MEKDFDKIARQMNTNSLAFLGDAVYELYIRNYVMEKGITDADRLHRMAVKYVRAEAQARAAEVLMREELSEMELSLFKRARNRKSGTKSRSAGPVDYRYATALEALTGGLWLSGKKERCEELMDICIAVTEGKRK